MKTVVCLMLAGMALSNPAPCLAQTAAASTITGAQRYTLTAAKTKHAYLIDILRVDSTVVKLPENYKLPVIYITDGNSLFPLVSHIASASVSFSTKIPAALVVAIGYVSDPALSSAQNIANSLSWRNRDLAPALSPGREAPPGMA